MSAAEGTATDVATSLVLAMTASGIPSQQRVGRAAEKIGEVAGGPNPVPGLLSGPHTGGPNDTYCSQGIGGIAAKLGDRGDRRPILGRSGRVRDGRRRRRRTSRLREGARGRTAPARLAPPAGEQAPRRQRRRLQGTDRGPQGLPR